MQKSGIWVQSGIWVLCLSRSNAGDQATAGLWPPGALVTLLTGA